MLSDNQLELIAEPIYQRINQINAQYLELIGTKIKEIGKLRISDVHRLQQLYTSGSNVDDIMTSLSKASAKNISDIQEMFDIVAKENYDYSTPFYAAKGLKQIPYADNITLQRYVKSQAEQTVNDYLNLAQHTAFAIFDKQGNIAPFFKENAGKVATSLSDTYSKVMDMAVQRASLGLSDYQSEMRSVIKAISDSGIRTVDYATGYHRRLDTSVRQNVLWGVKQTNQGVADITGKEFGADGYEIDYHANPRPTHVAMGGRQYAIGKPRTIKGVYYPSFDDVAGLLQDYGCLHFKFSILLGVSSPTYDKKELDALKAADRETVEIDGKEYTKYEASQLQRKLETAARHAKDRQIIAKAAGDDELRRQEQERINHIASKYKELSDKAGLPTKMERMRISGYHKVKTKTELLTNSKKSDIINKDDIQVGKSLGSAAFRDTVLLPDGSFGKIQEGSQITKVVVFAGKGTTKQVKVAKYLEAEYTIPASEWRKARGDGYVELSDGTVQHAELHWFENDITGRVKMKVKRWFK